MKLFKQFEFYGNILLISSFAIWFLISNSLESVLTSYFIVGAFQVVGMIIHAWNRWFTSAWSIRWVYHWLSFVLLVTMPIGSVWLLVYISPLLALLYVFICGRELKAIKLKELVHLK
jgi:hypothetical protein